MYVHVHQHPSKDLASVYFCRVYHLGSDRMEWYVLIVIAVKVLLFALYGGLG